MRNQENAELYKRLSEFQNSQPHENTWIDTFSRRKVNYLSFGSDDVDINDIANGLGNICRFGGQCSRWYSVAEHSVLVSKYVEYYTRKDPVDGLVLAALLHDAAEAYIGDVPTPLKRLLPGLRIIEERFEGAIKNAFGLSIGFDHQLIKRFDFEMYIRESDLLMHGIVHKDRFEINCLDPDSAKTLFIDRMREIGYPAACAAS